MIVQANLEKVLVRRGGQFFVGNNLTWADLAVFQFVSDGVAGKAPKVKIFESLILNKMLIITGCVSLPKYC